MSKGNSLSLLVEQPGGLIGGRWLRDDFVLISALITEQFECPAQGFLAFLLGAKLRGLCGFEAVIGSGESHAVRGEVGFQENPHYSISPHFERIELIACEAGHRTVPAAVHLGGVCLCESMGCGDTQKVEVVVGQ